MYSNLKLENLVIIETKQYESKFRLGNFNNTKATF